MTTSTSIPTAMTTATTTSTRRAGRWTGRPWRCCSIRWTTTSTTPPSSAIWRTTGEARHQMLHAVESFDQANGYLSHALELLKEAQG